MSTALVLFSGGQDSTTVLAKALSENSKTEAICFDYGQRHKIEIEQAQKIATLAHVPITIIDISLLSQLTTNALTRDLPIETKPGALPSTYVEGRNLVFLTFAAIFAKNKSIEHLYAGMCETDYSGYPDCREVFVQSTQQTLRLAMDYPFTLHTPLMHLTKAETVLLMQTLGKREWYAHTHTCYEGTRPACGQCPACRLRLKGFQDAGISDPLIYL